MKKQIFLGLALASWWTSLLIGQSPPQPPTPTISTQGSQQNRSTEQQRQDNANNPVQNQATTHSKSTDDKDRNRRDETANERIARFTVVLAVAAILQFIATLAQAFYMWKGLKLTNKSADAATMSANAATNAVENSKAALLKTERAVVLVSNVEAIRWQQPGTLDRGTVIFFEVKNFGRTTAYNVAFRGNITADGKSDELPQSASFTVAPSGESFWLSRSFGFWLDNISLNDINEGRATLSYSADVIYWDVFGFQHSQEVVGDWDAAAKRFNFAADKST